MALEPVVWGSGCLGACQPAGTGFLLSEPRATTLRLRRVWVLLTERRPGGTGPSPARAALTTATPRPRLPLPATQPPPGAPPPGALGEAGLAIVRPTAFLRLRTAQHGSLRVPCLLVGAHEERRGFGPCPRIRPGAPDLLHEFPGCRGSSQGAFEVWEGGEPRGWLQLVTWLTTGNTGVSTMIGVRPSRRVSRSGVGEPGGRVRGPCAAWPSLDRWLLTCAPCPLVT